MAKIESVEVQNPDGSTSRVQVGSKAYDRRLAAGGTILSGSGTNIKTSQMAVKQTKPVSEVGVISSNQGLQAVQTAQEKEAQLSPLFQGIDKEGKLFDIEATSSQEALKDPRLAEGSGVQQKDFTTFINPETEQELTLEGDANTPQKRSELESQGYQMAEGTLSAEEDSPEVQQAQDELDQITQEIDSYRRKMMSLLMSDSDLQGELNSISNSFDAQQEEMRRINENRVKSIRTMGIRLGSRYTGGSGGPMGSIIAEEQRQGIARIAELEAAKQAALMGAKKAAKEFNMQLYTSEINRAEKEQDRKRDEVEKLKEIQREREAELQAEAQGLQIEMSVASFVKEGVTDIFSLQALMPDVRLEEIQRIVDIVNPSSNLTGLSTDYRTYKAMIETGEISANSTYPDFLAMVANAKRAPKSGGGGDDDGTFDSPWGDKISSDTLNIMDGVASLKDLTPTVRSQVQSELRRAGYYSEEVPDWFIEVIEEQKQQNIRPEILEQEWAEHRQEVTGIEEEASEDEIESLIEQYPNLEAKIRQAASLDYSLEEIKEAIGK